jgi:hypothetical protein
MPVNPGKRRRASMRHVFQSFSVKKQAGLRIIVNAAEAFTES